MIKINSRIFINTITLLIFIQFIRLKKFYLFAKYGREININLLYKFIWDVTSMSLKKKKKYRDRGSVQRPFKGIPR